jgi:propanediol dehydratase small subunit
LAELRYPLAVTSRDAVRTASGKAVAEITLDGVVSGQLGPEDVAVAPETLRLQADFAKRAETHSWPRTSGGARS